jgi:hypothetical protein
MIELPVEVGSELREKLKENMSETVEANLKLQVVQGNQVQFNTLQHNQISTLQFNKEIRNIYLKKNGNGFPLNDYTWNKWIKKK